MKDKKHPWPSFIQNTFQTNIPKHVLPNEVAVTFINHATLLVQFGGINILTDPVFSQRVSPLKWLGPKRVREPGVAMGDLPKIDVVSVSHNHYDHLDLPSLKALAKFFDPVFVVPVGNAALLHANGIQKVIELDWWQSTTIKNCTIHCVPAQHWSGRSLRDRYKSLWGGFVYQYNHQKVYFAGDTGYNKHFKEIFEKFGLMDMSLLPIGAYEPRWFMKEQHINPEEAVKAHLDLHSRLSIGMHFGTFRLANEGHEHPLRDLKISLEQHQIESSAFITLEHGETKIVSGEKNDRAE